MATKRTDTPQPAGGSLSGNAPDRADAVLLLVDVINALDFPGASLFLPAATRTARRMAALKARCMARGIPTIYVNDNFGRWRSHFEAIVSNAMASHAQAAVRQVLPGPDDYFVLKPKNSGFYETTLHLLLGHIGARQLILAGFMADNCVTFTAHDAYLRGYGLWIPSDCTASMRPESTRAALHQAQRVLGADVRASTKRRLPSARRR